MVGRLIKGLLLVLSIIGSIAGLFVLTSRLLRQNGGEEAIRWYQKRAVPPRKRVVILGAGFGGLQSTLELTKQLNADPNVEVALVDRHNYHLFTPLLTAVAGGLVDSHHVAYPVRRAERTNAFLFHEAEVTGIDLDGKRVTLSNGELKYDYLVLALGSVTNFFNMPEVERLAFPFKSKRDAVELRNKVITAFEQAAWEQDPERRRQLLTFVFCGGGATGVELISAMSDFIHGSLIEEFPNVNKEEVRLVLVEAHPRLLPALDNFFSIVAHNKLLDKGIEVRTGSKLERLHTDSAGNLSGVEIQDAEVIPANTLIWTAGIEANPLMAALPVQKGKGGAIVVDEFLGVPGYPGVYALGDNASVPDPDDGRSLPPDAKVAVQLAKWVARNIANEIADRPREKYQYEHMGELVSLGTNAAVAEVRGVKVSGFPAFLLWRSFYFWRLLGFESKARIAWDYLYGLFADRDTAQSEVA